ncbi:MAG: GAF domain-containing protein [Firmicutes bacterium]|nr:GAF domain-containing protein [Bacillota bacterium]
MPLGCDEPARQMRDLQEELEQYRTEEEILYLTAQAVGETTDPQKLLDFLVERIGRRFGATYGHILLADEGEEVLRIRATWGVPLRECSHIRIRFGEGITGWVAMTGQPALVNDVREDPRYFPSQADTISEIAVPLRVRGQIIGVFNLEKNRPAGFTEHDCRMLSVAASLAASAIQTTKLLQERERRITELSLLYEVSSSVGGGDNLKQTCAKVVQAIKSSLGWYRVSLFVSDGTPGNGVRWLADTMGPHPDDSSEGPLVDWDLAQWCVRTGNAEVIGDVTSDARSVKVPGVRSALVAPLVAGRRIVGCVMALDPRPDCFTAQDLSLMSVIARDLGVILENARLNEELKRRVKDLSALYEVAAALSSTLDMDRVLNATFDMVGTLLGVERCSLMLLEANSEDLVMKAARGADPELINRVRFRVGEGLAGWAAREGRAVIVSDVSKEPRFKESIFQGPKIVSMACVPLISEGRVVGVLTVASSVPRQFTEDDTKMLYIIGSRAAVAIENAKLHEATRRLAVMDGVTACYNHRHMQELLAVEVQRALNSGTSVSLVMVDLDRFKEYNDTFGHPAGDVLLRHLLQQHVARRVAEGVAVHRVGIEARGPAGQVRG